MGGFFSCVMHFEYDLGGGVKCYINKFVYYYHVSEQVDDKNKSIH